MIVYNVTIEYVVDGEKIYENKTMKRNEEMDVINDLYYEYPEEDYEQFRILSIERIL